MLRKLSDGTMISLGQRKSNNSLKVGYVLKKGEWELGYEGEMKGLKKWVEHQKALADIREYRKMVGEMAGTSYEAAKRDMGL